MCTRLLGENPNKTLVQDSRAEVTACVLCLSSLFGCSIQLRRNRVRIKRVYIEIYEKNFYLEYKYRVHINTNCRYPSLQISSFSFLI